VAPEIYFPNLGIKIKHLNRIAIKLFNVDVYWYGVIIVFAILLGLFLISRELNKRNETIDDYLNFLILEIVCSIIGARLYYVAFSWDLYKDNLLEVINLRNGGIAIYGAVLTAILVGLVYTKLRKKSFYKMADLFIPYLCLGQAIGRWGNFFNREAFGQSTNSLFAMALRRDTLRVLPTSLVKQTVVYFGNEYISVHPTFLYESICSFVLFFYLISKRKKQKFDGELLFIYLICYSMFRFFIEGLRTDQLLILQVPISQLVAILLVILGIVLYIHRKRKLKEE